jgi:hypothetical protein
MKGVFLVLLALTLFFTCICEAQDSTGDTMGTGNINVGGITLDQGHIINFGDGGRTPPDDSVPEPSTASLLLFVITAALALRTFFRLKPTCVPAAGQNRLINYAKRMGKSSSALLALTIVFTGICRAQDYPSPPSTINSPTPDPSTKPPRGDGTESSVPEPSCLSLLALGGVVVALRRRR